MARRAAVVVGALLVVAGVASTSVALTQNELVADSAPTTTSTSTEPAATLPSPPPTTAAPPAAVPVAVEPAPDWTPTRVRVGNAEVDAPIDALGVDDQNKIQVPADPARVGWWSGGAEPGEDDPAVLVGHLDSTTGPGVFFGLEKLVPGDVVEVDRADGSTAQFMVERIESHPKDAFPTDEVYGSTDSSSLRLITCIGSFDAERSSYRDNLIVYANLMA